MSKKSYQVLARKYRPYSFDDLRGQDSMIRTLRNAFETGRIAHAFMLTGVRGVGKTTTARILARALNYQTEGMQEPQIDMPDLGIHCSDIMAGAHMDVIEMDAASKTGIGDIREIIESVRYKPTSGRYKVYIIDEVHMLSLAAFNALLKTLEEPPEHVKFIFATTEIRKVPITILSRCQRFDLRHLTSEETVKLLEHICQIEDMPLEKESLILLSRAAEGSARDALSLLDRVFAYGGSKEEMQALTLNDIRMMLGMADRGRLFDLFEYILQGAIAKALEEFSEQYRLGASPVAIITDLADLTYWLTRFKYIPSMEEDVTIAQEVRKRGQKVSEKLSIRVLSHLWQVLLKGHQEILNAHNQMAAAEMVLIRLAHLTDMPTPEDLIQQFEKTKKENHRNIQSSIDAPTMSQTTTQARQITQEEIVTDIKNTEPTLNQFTDVIALAEQYREVKLKYELENYVRLVNFSVSDTGGGCIELHVDEGYENIISRLANHLNVWTKQHWLISLSQEQGNKTVQQNREDSFKIRRQKAMKNPLIMKALETFPDSKILSVVDLEDNQFDDE